MTSIEEEREYLRLLDVLEELTDTAAVHGPGAVTMKEMPDGSFLFRIRNEDKDGDARVGMSDV